jgi:rhamnosyltransferase subunit B
MANVLFTTMGTWGDLFPMIGVGVELAGPGHRVRIAAPPVWSNVVESAGLDFMPLGSTESFAEFVDHPEVLAPIPWGLRKAMRWFLFDQIDLLTDQLTAAVPDADLVVTHPAHVVAHDVAEQFGVPRVVATVFPMMIPSDYTVPGGSLFGPWQGRLGHAANRMAWRFGHVGSKVFFDRPINGHRRHLGLPPVRAGIIRLPLTAAATVVMADPAFIDPPPDWPSTVTVTSFVNWDLAGQAAIPEDVERFLAVGDPPVLVTLGASGAIDPEDFLQSVAQEIADIGLRVLVVTGPARLPNTNLPDSVLVVEYIPFSLVGHRCQAAVHHGGVGTTAAFVRAGVPQVAVPKGFDQPLTAARVEALGIGRSIPWRKRHGQIGPTVKSVLADRRIFQRAIELAARLRPDGAKTSADVIDAVLAGIAGS